MARHSIDKELWEWAAALQEYVVVFIHSDVCYACLENEPA